MKYNFPMKSGSGLAKLLPHANSECMDLMLSLLQYDPDLRISARQALKHPYFKDLRYAVYFILLFFIFFIFFNLRADFKSVSAVPFFSSCFFVHVYCLVCFSLATFRK
jgi:serine/threonine protein kinase